MKLVQRFGIWDLKVNYDSCGRWNRYYWEVENPLCILGFFFFSLNHNQTFLLWKYHKSFAITHKITQLPGASNLRRLACKAIMCYTSDTHKSSSFSFILLNSLLLPSFIYKVAEVLCFSSSYLSFIILVLSSRWCLQSPSASPHKDFAMELSS